MKTIRFSEFEEKAEILSTNLFKMNSKNYKGSYKEMVKSFEEDVRNKLKELEFNKYKIYYKGRILREKFYINKQDNTYIHIYYSSGCDWSSREMIIRKLNFLGINKNEKLIIDEKNKYSKEKFKNYFGVDKVLKKGKNYYLNVKILDNINNIFEDIPNIFIIDNYYRDENNNPHHDFDLNMKINKNRKYFYPYKESKLTWIGVDYPNPSNPDKIRTDLVRPVVYFSSVHYKYNPVFYWDLIEYNTNKHIIRFRDDANKGDTIIFVSDPKMKRIIKDTKRTKTKTTNNYKITSRNVYVEKEGQL